MATLKEILYNGDKVLVEAAKRDSNGKIIANYYVSNEALEEVLKDYAKTSALSSYVTSQNLATSLSSYWSKSSLFTNNTDKENGYQTLMSYTLTDNDTYNTITFTSTYYYPFDESGREDTLPINIAKFVIGGESKSILQTASIDIDSVVDNKINEYSEANRKYDIPKLIPVFHISTNSLTVFTYTNSSPLLNFNNNNTIRGAYFNASMINFKLSHPLDDESEYIIVMFQRKKRFVTTQKKGTVFTHMGSYSSNYRYLNDVYHYDTCKYGSWDDITPAIELSTTILSNFRTEWSLNSYAGNKTYYLSGYIPMVLSKGRGSYTALVKNAGGSLSINQTDKSRYQSPEIAFALCKVENGQLIRGPMTIIKIGIYNKDNIGTDTTHQMRFRWVS